MRLQYLQYLATWWTLVDTIQVTLLHRDWDATTSELFNPKHQQLYQYRSTEPANKISRKILSDPHPTSSPQLRFPGEPVMWLGGKIDVPAGSESHH